METIRVFISYSHEDQELVKEIVQALRDNGLKPVWSEDFLGGWAFHEAIKNFITHAHVFMPILTRAASQRGWVHQEIGYAIALNIPVIPVTSDDQLPKEMLEPFQGVVLSNDPREYRNQLPRSLFENRVKEAQEKAHALFECAEFQEDRTRMLVEYSSKVRSLGFHGRVRQKATLSSFNIPDLPLSHNEWTIRHGKYKVSQHLCEWLLKERRAMEEHAREAGCSLIIYPYIVLKEFGPEAKRVRLKTLKKFIESIPSDKVQVAIKNEGFPRGYNLIILGDWFAAEAVRSFWGEGYRQTILTRHAPTVRSKLEAFDFELKYLLQEQGLTPESSREQAIKTLQQVISDLEKEPDDPSK